VIQCNQIKFLVYVALCTTVLFIIHQIKFLLYVALCTAVQTPNFPAKEKKPRSGSITTGEWCECLKTNALFFANEFASFLRVLGDCLLLFQIYIFGNLHPVLTFLLPSLRSLKISYANVCLYANNISWVLLEVLLSDCAWLATSHDGGILASSCIWLRTCFLVI